MEASTSARCSGKPKQLASNPLIDINANTLWARTFVHALFDSGVRIAVISPGSRSTPLTISFAEHPQIEVFSILDERGAAFFALGAGLSTDLPTALVCTSGTAVANLFPAAMEANLARVPLILLTADRPHDVRSSGANQSVDQIKLFGNHVRWFEDVAEPEALPLARTIRYLSTLAARAVGHASGPMAGPVHLNFPFRKPLEPITSTDAVSTPSRNLNDTHNSSHETTIVHRGKAQITEDILGSLVTHIQRTSRGLLVCGPSCPDGGFPDAVQRLAQVTGYPILADCLSGVRFGLGNQHGRSHVLGGYETFLSAYDPKPELIFRFGTTPISMKLQALLETTTATQILVAAHEVWQDPSHRIEQWVLSDEEHFCEALYARCTTRQGSYLEEMARAEDIAWESASTLEKEIFFEGAVLPAVVNSLPDGCNLVVGNSLPIRHLDHFVRPQQKHLAVYCNRGASGIDGTIATATGVGASSTQPLVVVLGDLALYHDLNSLFIFQRCNILGTIVVLNNNGGGLFHSLPIARHDPPFTELFITPHGLRFEHAAAMFGLDYIEVYDRPSLEESLTTAITATRTTLIEVVTDSANNQAISAQLSRVFKQQYDLSIKD